MVKEAFVLPTSFAQQRLWLVEQLDPGSPLYNMPQTIRLHGLLNLEALRQTLETVVARHETLRTTFATVDGSPVQVVTPKLPVTLPVVDLSDLPDARREATAQQLATEEAQRPFDLARGPLMRVTLLRLGDEEHMLLLNMHHIVSDDWSVGVLMRELTALYGAFSVGKPSPLPELPIQYADFAQWQRTWMQGNVLEQQLAYWKRQLVGAPYMLNLPTDHPRPAKQTFQGASLSVMLPPNLSDGLKALSHGEGATLFMTLLAAFQVLLSRYTNQDDVVVGSPIANRTRVETEGLIGPFFNNLILRTDLSGDPTFRELLERVRETTLGAYAHQDLPFEKLVEELQPERSLSHTPLFQVMFTLLNAPTSALELPGLILCPVEVSTGTSKYDLVLDMIEEKEGLQGRLYYSTDLFDATTVGRMMGHFETLLQGILAYPDQRISTLPLLTEAELKQVLSEWNDTQIDFGGDVTLHYIFERQVERDPDAVAVRFEDQQVTYGELNGRANQLAHHLQALDVGPDVLVGLCVERSIEMMVGILGILKAGGAYVPLDPEYPQERLAFMLDDSRVPVLLTQQRLVEKLPETVAHIISLDADWVRIAQENAENPVSGARAENLAYVIYTSGSTGRPKGVQVCHRSVVRLLEATRPLFGFDESDVWTVVHSYAFDFSVWEIWGCLLHGSRLVIVPLWKTQSPAAFYALLRAERVTVLNQTPSAIRQLIQAKEEAGDQAKDLSLRLIACGGEAFPPELAAPLLGLGVPAWNFYGPTEATVWAAINQITSPESKGQSIPIGRPFANVQIYLLNQNLQPVPIGVPGELYIGGDGLARGYLNRPELTAERFIPHPFSSAGEARLYKTGDLARYLPDGKIEFLGRIDHQVKIRGFRIELGEIEAVLAGHPAVRESVVLVREDVPGEKRLVAYLVPQVEPAPTAGELRSFLKKKLPEYMVPAAFVLLETLPLSTNGKVDRRTLPMPDQVRPHLEEAFVAPGNAVEEVVAGIWAEVLGVERVGVLDNFFELGGHSLLATQVISRVQEAFQVEVPLRSMFESPTVAGLAVSLETIGGVAPQDLIKIAEALLQVNELSADEVKMMLADGDHQPLEIGEGR